MKYEYECGISCSCCSNSGGDSEVEETDLDPPARDSRLRMKIGKLKILSLCLGLLAVTFHLAVSATMVTVAVHSLSVEQGIWGALKASLENMTQAGAKDATVIVTSAVGGSSLGGATALVLCTWLFIVGKVAASFSPPINCRHLNPKDPAWGYFGFSRTLFIASFLDVLHATMANHQTKGDVRLIWGCCGKAFLILATVFTLAQAVACHRIGCLEKEEVAMEAGKRIQDEGDQSFSQISDKQQFPVVVV